MKISKREKLKKLLRDLENEVRENDNAIDIIYDLYCEIESNN